MSSLGPTRLDRSDPRGGSSLALVLPGVGDRDRAALRSLEVDKTFEGTDVSRIPTRAEVIGKSRLSSVGEALIS